jgi:hypothetical protein
MRDIAAVNLVLFDFKDDFAHRWRRRYHPWIGAASAVAVPAPAAF